jgi:hypothetical protein
MPVFTAKVASLRHYTVMLGVQSDTGQQPYIFMLQSGLAMSHAGGIRDM